MVTVYVIESVFDQVWYTGITKDIIRRLAEHNAGRNRFTKGHRPWKIIVQKIIQIKFFFPDEYPHCIISMLDYMHSSGTRLQTTYGKVYASPANTEGLFSQNWAGRRVGEGQLL